MDFFSFTKYVFSRNYLCGNLIDKIVSATSRRTPSPPFDFVIIFDVFFASSIASCGDTDKPTFFKQRINL